MYESVEVYYRFLDEKLQEVRKSLDSLLSAVVAEDGNAKVAATKELRGSLQILSSSLATQDRPSWIQKLDGELQRYLKNRRQPAARLRMIKAVITTYRKIQDQKWKAIDPGADAAIDLDGIFLRYYEESRIPELFDKLIEQLTQVSKSGEIDSLRVLQALERLTATIKKNSRGSYFSVHGTWDFAAKLFENFLWEALSDIPALGAPVRALRKTMEELQEEMAGLQERVGDEISVQATADPPQLVAGPAGFLEAGDDEAFQVEEADDTDSEPS